ncbi:quinone-dependent dihydroorotate dehydrogenase [Nocardioides sp. SR21]|uniref:quinone-dependent dihydroorotate dehydrogenase n=1 Tax=Nocardioides sp. SR21 TaxID=2919501 RepID=UPI0035B3D165
MFDKVLTRTDPEKAHHTAFRAIRAARPVTGLRGTPGNPVAALGLTFPNVLGLAAGFDKNAVGIDGLGALGFGHVEIGTVTGEAQPGNPQPRLFRLPDDRAVVNRMGFNNDGAEVVAARLAARAESFGGRAGVSRTGPVLGVNIGKSKVVPEDEAVRDYEKSARLLAPHADYLVVNVSSPNTPGLRNLQAVEKLEPILTAVQAIAAQGDRRVPLLVKIAPDLADDDVLGVADLALAIGLDGIIATNTTISRAGLRTCAERVEQIGAGGLSGRPLTDRSCDVVRLLRGRVGPDLTLIGVGGITTVADAQARLDAGATLLQGYTAFIYEGPLWPRRIVKGVQE